MSEHTEYDELADLGDALKAEKDKVAALEERLSKMEEAAHLAIDDIRDALQSNEYSDAVTITVALDLCLEAREALAGERR